MLHWVIELIPLAVFGVVASIVATKGFGAFVDLGIFVVSVLMGLGLHLTYYLLRIGSAPGAGRCRFCAGCATRW